MSTVVGDAAGRWPMRLYRTLWLFASLISFGSSSAAFAASQAEEQLLIAYGSVSETNVPLWLGIERGFFKKQGIGARMVQVKGCNREFSGAYSAPAQGRDRSGDFYS